MDCLFCKIAAGELPAEKVYDQAGVFAVRDINPQGPVHLLIIPHQHIATLNDLSGNESELVGNMVLAAQQLAMREGIAESGYRTVFNCNGDAGQSVDHIHLHLIGGRKMRWPPG